MRTFFAFLAFLLFAICDTAVPVRAQQTTLPPHPARRDLVDSLRLEETMQSQQAERWATRRDVPVALTQRDGRRVRLVGVVNDRPSYLSTTNDRSAVITHTNDLYPGARLGIRLTGRGMKMGIWDGGVPLTSHQEFGGRVTVVDRVSADDHATHVAGTLIGGGVRPEARGMAFEASLRAFDWDQDASEMASEASRGLLVSNHSYGIIAGWYYGDLEDSGDQWYWLGDPTISRDEDYTFGWYDVDAAQVDRVTAENPFYLPVVAAGNDRNDRGPRLGSYRALDDSGNWQTYSTSDRIVPADGGPEGYDTISGAAVAKNVLTVGSIGIDPTGATRSSTFSSFGPVDDGRVKPDLVGFGEQVLSAVASSPRAYDTMSGTSMATPNVAGSLLLLQQYYSELTGTFLRAATLKGLALHTARDLGPHGPDYQTGWGLLDARKAATLLAESLSNDAAVQESVLADDAPFSLRVTMAETDTLRVTLSWTDPASSRRPVRGPSSLDDPTPRLRNDLDLRVTNVATGEVFRPYVLDPQRPSALARVGDNAVDPVEQIFVPNAPAGAYRITVSHKGTLVTDTQPFSLLVSGATGTVRPVVVTHTEADATLDRVHLSWQTPREGADGSFVIQRRRRDEGETTTETAPYLTVGEVALHGDETTGAPYTFDDRNVPSGYYTYRIRFQSGDDDYVAKDVNARVPVPEQYAVLSSYPNPFTDRTTLVLDVPGAIDVEVAIFNVLGQRIRTVYEGRLTVGRHELPVAADDWPPGVYFARVESEDGVLTRKLILGR